jgi:hypothetical protein
VIFVPVVCLGTSIFSLGFCTCPPTPTRAESRRIVIQCSNILYLTSVTSINLVGFHLGLNHRLVV